MKIQNSLAAAAAAVSVISPVVSAGIILDEFSITSNSLRMEMSGVMPTFSGDYTQIRISAEEGRDMIGTPQMFLSNGSGMSFHVTNGSGLSNAYRVDSQSGNDQIILLFDHGGFQAGAVVAGVLDFALPGGASRDIGASTTFLIEATRSSGHGTTLFSGVTQSSTSTPVPGPMALAAFAGIAAARRRRR